MTSYDENIIFNGVTLNVLTLDPFRKQRTRKSVIGKTLTEISIVGLADQQWEINLSGIILGAFGTDLSDARAEIEALDSATFYTYTDGIHDGTYILKPGSLRISDTSDNVAMKYDYSMVLVEQ